MEVFLNKNKTLRSLFKCFKKDSDLSASIHDDFMEYYKSAFRDGDQETVIDEEEDVEELYGENSVTRRIQREDIYEAIEQMNSRAKCFGGYSSRDIKI